MSQTLPPAYGGGEGGGGFVLGPVNNVFGATSGSGSISGVTIATSKTVAAATRDAYDTANSGWISGYTDIDVNIILYYQDGSDNVVQYQRHIGTSWVDNGSPIVAVQGQSGNAASLANVTTGNIPQKGSSGEFEDSSISETSEIVQSSKPFATTPTSILFGANGAEIASSGTVVVFEGTDDSEAFLLQNQFNPTNGSVDVVRSRLIPRAEYTVQPTKTVNSVQNPTFTYTLAAIGPDQNPVLAAEDRRHTDQLTIESPDTGTITAVFRDTDANGRLLRTQSAAITADTETAIDLVKPICTDIGRTIHVTVTGDVRLKGDTINTEFSPFLKIRSYLGYDDQIATAFTMNDLADAIRDSLETLTGSDRLDASAIQNLPSGSGGVDVQDDGTEVVADADTINVTGSGATVTDVGGVATINIPGGISGVEVQDEGSQIVAFATQINFAGPIVTVTDVGGVATVTIAGMPTPPQATHTNYIDVTTDSNASSVDLVGGVSSDDLNPTVTLETFTGNRYIQILQSQAHTRFTSIVLSGINQIGAFTINDDARTISGQAYRQYVTTNLITDAFSGSDMTMGGAS